MFKEVASHAASVRLCSMSTFTSVVSPYVGSSSQRQGPLKDLFKHQYTDQEALQCSKEEKKKKICKNKKKEENL